ncbi:MAG: endopeptidase La [Candidatus Babeliales bacterium]
MNSEIINQQPLHQPPLHNMLPLLPLKNVVILPKTIVPIIVGREISVKAVEEALRGDGSIFISTQKDGEVENPTQKDVFEYGIRATILQVPKEEQRRYNGMFKILVEGLSRAKIVSSHVENGFIMVTCQDLPTTNLELSTHMQALWRYAKGLYESYARLNEKIPADLMSLAKTAEDMDTIADTIAVHLNLSFFDRQELVETVDLKERLTKLSKFLAQEIEILETEKRIKGRVQNQVEKNQREYYLTEQIKAIQKELGRDDHQHDINEIRAKIKTLGLPEEVYEKTEKELKRLDQMPPLSAEAVVSRNYVDWVISLPWNKQSKDRISLAQAEKILNQKHAGLSKAKERIIEFLAAKKYSKSLERSPIICLVGAPGVGKTSLASSIAESLGREFVRISLGGIRDEAEIRGHRRTYIGALPGKILQAMRKAKTVNPVILLDEIDKMTRDIHGDPAAALLEVLDPEQNKNFVDHFLEVEYDLSKVMFIATANMIDTIPLPLFDRMEIITLPGYIDEEKVTIARKFLIPKGLKEHSLDAHAFKISDELLEHLVSYYTREAGVRQLERVLNKLMRKVIQELLNKPEKKSVAITKELIVEWLGYQKYKKTSLDHSKDRCGLATGLAWTEVGGDILEIESTVLPGKGNVTLTGQLGEVMQESAQAALSYIRSRSAALGINASFHSNKDIHVHLPEGATPKDGPSAGITMCAALVSMLTKNPTKAAVAMTGEITLRGRVLAVGGLKEKLLAAQQHGMKTVLVPKENEDDINEMSKEVKTSLSIIFVENMDEVLKHALVNDPFILKPKRKRKKRTKKKSKK